MLHEAETVRLYENDSYLKEFQAQVADCVPAEHIFPGKTDGWAVSLDRTAFFPEGGGQGADTGQLCTADGIFPVWDVQLKDGVVYHHTALNAAPKTAVTGRICWEQRFSNMQQHSGEHIFSGLVNRYFGYRNVGFHLGSQAVTMDFDGMLSPEDIGRLELEANQVIVQNVPITVSYPDRETLETLRYRSKIEIGGQVRIVTVEGCDVCACCAPHVARTGEIGLLKVVDAGKYKGGVRISILCGFRALEDYGRRLDSTCEISRLLSAPPLEIVPAVERELNGAARLRQKLYERTQQLMTRVIESVPRGQKYIWLFEEELDAAAMRRTVNLAVKRAGVYAGVFCGSDPDGYKYVIGAVPGVSDATQAAAALKEAFGARGGGRPEMVQGFVSAPRRTLETFLEKL